MKREQHKHVKLFFFFGSCSLKGFLENVFKICFTLEIMSHNKYEKLLQGQMNCSYISGKLGKFWAEWRTMKHVFLLVKMRLKTTVFRLLLVESNSCNILKWGPKKHYEQ